MSFEIFGARLPAAISPTRAIRYRIRTAPVPSGGPQHRGSSLVSDITAAPALEPAAAAFEKKPPYDPSLLEAVHATIRRAAPRARQPAQFDQGGAHLAAPRRHHLSARKDPHLPRRHPVRGEPARTAAGFPAPAFEPAVHGPEPFDALPFLDHFLAQYRYDVERRGIVVEVQPLQAGLLAADPVALSQVLLELLNAAVQRLGRVDEPRLEIAAGAARRRLHHRAALERPRRRGRQGAALHHLEAGAARRRLPAVAGDQPPDPAADGRRGIDRAERRRNPGSPGSSCRSPP